MKKIAQLPLSLVHNLHEEVGLYEEIKCDKKKKEKRFDLMVKLSELQKYYPENKELKNYFPNSSTWADQEKFMEKKLQKSKKRTALRQALHKLLPTTIKAEVVELLNAGNSSEETLLEKIAYLDRYLPESEEIKKYLPNSKKPEERKRVFEKARNEKAPLTSYLDKTFDSYEYGDYTALPREIESLKDEIDERNDSASTLSEKVQNITVTALKATASVLWILNAVGMLEGIKFSPPLKKVNTISKEWVGDYVLYFIFKSCIENILY